MTLWDEQIPGTGGGTSAIPFGGRRRPRLADLIGSDDLNESDEATFATDAPLADRIPDEPIQHKSGGPGAPAPSAPISSAPASGLSPSPGPVNATGGRGQYADPGVGHLAELRSRRSAMDVPQPKEPLWKQILGEGVRLAPTILAYASGASGATEGAASGYEEGVKRRQSQRDLKAQQSRQDKLSLDQEIEQEQRAAEQRQFTHGEDVLRQETAEKGLTLREKMAQEAETGRNTRLVETIAGQDRRQQAGFGQQDELEDRRQAGRMEMQRAKADAQMAVARYRAAHPNTNLPPILGKAFQTYQGSQSRMDVMDQSYKEAIRDPGNQQAMLNLLASHLGMTMGLQPGARMNQAIINEAQRSGYLDERIQAHFGPDGYMTGVVLTPRQMGQMLELAKGRLMEDARAVKETEAYLGRSGQAPITPRVPDQGQDGAGAGAGGAGATPANAPIPKPPGPPHPGMQWQYSPSRKQFREVPVIASK